MTFYYQNPYWNEAMKQPLGYLFISLITAATAFAEAKTVETLTVEVTLQHNLDGYLNGYCLDIVGGGGNLYPERGLQAHTCYSYRGNLGADQSFDAEQIPDKRFYMPEVDMCIELESLTAGAKVGLGKCDNSDLQRLELQADGSIRPIAAPQKCFTAALATAQGRNGTSPHQIKALTLEACAADKAIFQQWRTRSEKD